MHLLKVCINLFLLILVPLNIVSQTYSVRKFSTSNGLLSNSINDCNFDKNGFLWIATQAGLSRFDGRKFKNHTSNNFEGIRSNRFKVIYKLKNGKRRTRRRRHG
jgi:ligand-binding sensor domain-containing protein